MKGTIMLKIIAAPNTATEVLIEKMNAEMPLIESGKLYNLVSNIKDIIDGINGYTRKEESE